MTVQDGSNVLFEWFGTNDSFVMERDFVNALTKSGYKLENSEVDKIALELALQSLVESSMLGTLTKEESVGAGKSKEKQGVDYWVLQRPYDAWQQNLELTPMTAKYIAGEINSFCEMLDDKSDMADSSRINEKDLRNLIHIINFWRSKSLGTADASENEK
jgi:hypothetical protein